MHLPEGTLLCGGKYEIVRYISSGGFGCTYEARNTAFRNRTVTVAIKEFFVKDFCNRDAATNNVVVGTNSREALVEKLKSKFMDEAEALYALNHPNIVRVTDLFEDKNTVYYVMDYIEGGSLSGIISEKGRLAEKEALGYILQIADALKYVHSHNCLHLDVKPQNIMIDNSGKATLIDFGVSKQYDEANGENTSTLMGSTPGYAPIEQTGACMAKFYPASDIYALGATLYKALTGITPPPASLIASGERELDPLPATVSAAVQRAVEASMQLNRSKRPQSIGEFVGLLEGIWQKAESEETEISEVEVVESDANSTIISVTPSREHNNINGHEYVDLGLPSGLKWATCNVGASKPEEYGSHYAWGETNTKHDYSEGTYTHCRRRSLLGGFLTWDYKYDELDNIGADAQYDVARKQWGSPWRLPAKADFDELCNENNCEWTWTKQNGVSGYKVTSKKNGNSIFLPAAGWRNGSSLNGQGAGCYWSSTPHGSNSYNAYYLYFNSGHHVTGCSGRDGGQSVRPVSE